MTIYVDCNATAPLEPAVTDLVTYYLTQEYGNAGSRAHEFGAKAKAGVETARAQVASVVDASKDEVIFTSGATESNNLAILGLAQAASAQEKKHIITTAIEHKAVLEPIAQLEQAGFQVSYLSPNKTGIVDANAVADHLRADTGLVSIMQVNNETGAIQPIKEVVDVLAESSAYFHVDAAQGFGKEIDTLKHQRIDLISISGHKIYGPKGSGALVTRRRNYKRPPLSPIMYGGGQEKGLRPGTLPVALIAGFGLAAELADKNNANWTSRCSEIKRDALHALKKLDVAIHSEDHALPNVLNFSLRNVNSEAAIVALKGVIAISNGSACTSSSYTPSHVLKAMQLDDSEIQGALRLSWCHMTEVVDWKEVANILKSLT